jgi:hypothetical protein
MERDSLTRAVWQADVPLLRGLQEEAEAGGEVMGHYPVLASTTMDTVGQNPTRDRIAAVLTSGL